MIDRMGKSLFCFVCFLIIQSCHQEDFVPKPKAYPKIAYPDRSYLSYNKEHCPFYFEYPSYATVEDDSLYFDHGISEKCWLNIHLPVFNGTIHVSYKEISAQNTLEDIIADTHELTYAHTDKADYIDEFQIINPNGVEGLLFEVGGNAASSIQFYVTDYSLHYLRGSLYFNTSPNSDSLSPVVDFVKADILHMMETFNWK